MRWKLEDRLGKPVRHGHRVVAGEAGVAKAGPGYAGRLLESVEAQISQAVSAEVVADLADLEVGRHQFATGPRVQTVETWPAVRGRRNTQVHFLGPHFSQHREHALGRGAADDRVVHDDQALAGDRVTQRVQFAPDTRGALAG